MKTAVFIAWRFLTNARWQSLFIALGIAVGVAVQMFVGLLIDSLQANLIDRTVGTSPHLTIRAREKGDPVKLPDEIITGIRKQVSGIKVIQKTVEGNVFATGTEKNYTALLKGVERDGGDIYGIRTKIVAGNFFRTNREVVIGSELARELSLSPGNAIRISDGSGVTADFRISGIFTTGIAALDKSWIVGDVRLAQGYFGFGKDATAVVIQVEDVFAVPEIKASIADIVDTRTYEIATWQEENTQLLSALSSQSSSSFMIQFFVLLSVTIAISSILSVTVLQKSRQIGILKAMGLNELQTVVVFLTMSLILGAVGATLGSFLGFALFFLFANGPKNPDGSPVFVPVIKWLFVYGTWVVTVVAAVVAGVFPARRSAKLSPVEIIQNG